MLSVLHSQYHACWCSGDFRSQGINRHGIDPQSRDIPSPASEELIDKRSPWSRWRFIFCEASDENVFHEIVKNYFGRMMIMHLALNSFRPRQNRRHFADDILKCIFLNENLWIPIKISLKFVPKGSIDNIAALVQIMAWRRLGDKPLSEPIMVSLLTHICISRPQWVKQRYWQEVSIGSNDGLAS